MAGQHHRFNGCDGQMGNGLIPGDSEGQGGLVCCSPWGRKESDMTELLTHTHFSVKPQGSGNDSLLIQSGPLPVFEN